MEKADSKLFKNFFENSPIQSFETLELYYKTIVEDILQLLINLYKERNWLELVNVARRYKGRSRTMMLSDLDKNCNNLQQSAKEKNAFDALYYLKIVLDLAIESQAEAMRLLNIKGDLFIYDEKFFKKAKYCVPLSKSEIVDF